MEERFAVTAATGALGPVLVKLAALLGYEYKLHEKTRGDIMFIRSELDPVHALLVKLWGREDLDVACKDWMTEARELSYDMEDDIDGFTLGLGHGDDGSFIQREAIGRHFKEFMERVKDVSKWCGKMLKICDTICNRSKLTTDPRALFLHRDASELVGMEEKEKELISLLKKHEMVCIVGPGGMGKTTLADLIYDAVRDEFQCRAFVSVHPNPNMMEILGTILSQVTTDGAMFAGSGTETAAGQNIVKYISISPSGTEPPAEQNYLIKGISTFLSDKRYVVIIDDIWHWEKWEVIRKALPKNNLGCKLIMTTRARSIAEKCRTEQGAHVYEQKFGRADAARLSTMSLSKSVEGTNVKGLSTKIADMCGGPPFYFCPLAVICLSSAWSENQVQGDDGEWDTWVNHLLMDRFLIAPSLKPLVQSLGRGFDDLPVHLSSCFLYCSIYPPGYPIERDCLVRKWIAEGFVSRQEVAEVYFDDLVCRNLLQPIPEFRNLNTVHTIMIAFLVCKAKEANFVTVSRHVNNGPGSSSHATQIRRLSISKDRDPEEDVSQARSLFVVVRQLDGVPFKKFKNLRVLEIDFCDGLEKGHLVDICGLIWLRYLGIKGALITELPGEIGRLQNLETLDVSGTGISKLPNEIEKLQHLETLDISATEVTGLPNDIGKLQHLERLNISHTMVTELPKEIVKLQRLKTLNVNSIKVTELPREILKLQSLENLDVCNTGVEELPKEIGELQNLRNLYVCNTGVKELPKEIEELQNLRNLDVCNTGVKELPKEIGKLQNLRNLDVCNTGVKELPKEIGKLQNLRNLDVRNTKVRELPWEVSQLPNSVSALVGGMDSYHVVKLPHGVSQDLKISSSGAKCREELSVMLFDRIGSRWELLPVPRLKVVRRHMKVLQWVKQDLRNVSSLDIRLCKLVEEDLKFLKTQMPNLQALTLRFEVLPREPVAITGGGFSKLETFYVDCRLPRVVTFKHEAMPKLKHLEFKFYTGTASQDYSMGILHLPSLEKVVFRCFEYYTSDSPSMRETIEAVRKEAAEHPNCITLYVNDKQPEVLDWGVQWISQADKAIIQKVREERERIRRQRELLSWAAERRARHGGL